MRGDSDQRPSYAWGDPVLVTLVAEHEGQFVEVAAGAHCGIARRADGTIAVWAAPHGECSSAAPLPIRPSPTVIPPSLPPAVSVAAGHCTVYILTDVGYVLGWGGSFLCNQQTMPWDDSTYTEIAGGYVSSIAKRMNGTIVAWGAEDELVCEGPGGDLCCPFKFSQAPIPATLSQITGLKLAKGHSNWAHFVIVPNGSCP
ncbi:MAG: hypothetical protein ACKVW3_06035 [Phycisphaerales bacterium]